KGFDAPTATLLYFAHLLNELGMGPNVDSCVFCGSKEHIAGFSYVDGGFVCKNDLNDSTDVCGSRKLKILRYIFRSRPENFLSVTFKKEECLEILDELANYLDGYNGIKITSLSLFK
ncbi:MAG: DNA repair protein RecO C-terminal domain-containing protein, partial [Bacilli bacterium]|nr:DNA repair protein RecO C-terminal domain-containing protein [Bacilli bacterium]